MTAHSRRAAPLRSPGRPRARQLDADVGTAIGTVRRARITPVGAGDDLHDREAQPRSAATARAICSGEALERLADELGGEAGTLVAHMQLDAPVAPRCTEPDRPGAVLQGVLDEIVQRLLDATWVGRQVLVRLADHDPAPGLARSLAEAELHPCEESFAVDLRRCQTELTAMCPRDDEQRLGELSEAIRLLGSRAECLA